MKTHDMTEISIQLSAYLDGALPEAERAEIEALIATDPEVQAEFDMLMLADAEAHAQFTAQADHPIPLDLVKMIKEAPLSTEAPAETAAANLTRRPLWNVIAAGVACLAIGLGIGQTLAPKPAPSSPSWLHQIADYHGIYAQQGRHLVEVSAAESDHLQSWLGKTVGTTFSIPDLTDFGLTFEGGRLLAAAGKPVAQLMYRTETGDVIALCFLNNGNDALAPDFKTQTLNGFDMVSWQNKGSNFVIIGPEGFPELPQIAQSSAISL